jgi:hypothetical protein
MILDYKLDKETRMLRDKLLPDYIDNLEVFKVKEAPVYDPQND